MRRLATALLGATVLTAGACQDEMTTAVSPIEPDFARTGTAASATYEITVANLTSGQPLTPPLAATHRRPLGLFEIGTPASLGLREIAENGNLTPLNDALSEEHNVSEVLIAAGSPPPILPGAERTFTISSERGAKYFSFVSMLICSNDGFTGVNAIRLPDDVGESVELDAMAYDAGSEINTEDFADIVPPCAGLTGVPSTDQGTGMSNPALAEDGVVHPHSGVAGIDDLVPSIHSWSGPVVSVRVTRIG
jgi:hypothetical protein